MLLKLILLAAAGALSHAADLAVGRLLVASETTRDAELAKSVILLVHYDEQGAIGLMINRRANVPLTEVYPGMKGASIDVFAGGPVSIGIRALVRSRSKPEEATHIFGDVFMISTKPVLARLVGSGTPAARFRVYAGYTGWSTQQLKSEVARGLWRVLPGDAAVVFDSNPGALWPRLTKRP